MPQSFIPYGNKLNFVSITLKNKATPPLLKHVAGGAIGGETTMIIIHPDK